MRDPTRLEAYRLADQLVFRVYDATKAFPRREAFGLTGQMRRAVLSIPCNIVEGCAKPSQSDYIRFLDIAFGSAQELGYLISVAHRLGYLADDQHRELAPRCKSVSRTLAALTRALRNRT